VIDCDDSEATSVRGDCSLYACFESFSFSSHSAWELVIFIAFVLTNHECTMSVTDHALWA
jgi:hypothetical protein